jgi:Asp-tRNA(Asn)/Glu-tRNA(Gln) amidotransferase A subunit family amidase
MKQGPYIWSRRDFLAAAAAWAAALSACGGARHPSRTAFTDLDLAELPAADAVRHATEATSPPSRTPPRSSNDARPARPSTRSSRAAGKPLGALHGLPVPIKDSVNTKDLPTTGGTPALRSFQPKEDAPIVRVLADAGAILLGKTNLHELSFGWTSNNQAFGPVRNPYDPTRIPGGSTGGTAVAVAARMAPLRVAEGTEGSIRVSAALTGIAGFRPTTGRYPSSGVIPITPLFDQVGPHARCVAEGVWSGRNSAIKMIGTFP